MCSTANKKVLLYECDVTKLKVEVDYEMIANIRTALLNIHLFVY